MKFLRLIIATIVFMLLLVSCKSSTDNPYGYDVNSISKLQKSVPFKIVVPTYFPNDIIPYPSEIWGPSQDPVSNSLGFGLVFRSKTGDMNHISIHEDNEEAAFKPTESTSIYLSISGIKVLQEETLQLVPSKTNKEPTELNGYFYGWYNQEASIEVRIYGYQEEECRKVIESMIK
jgi:hypothetical protein